MLKVRLVGTYLVERNAEHVADNGLSGIQSVQCLLEIISMGGGVNILADFVHTSRTAVPVIPARAASALTAFALRAGVRASESRDVFIAADENLDERMAIMC